MTLGWCAALLGAIGSPARAQADLPNPEQVLARVERAYATGSVADAFEIEIWRAGEVRREAGVARFNLRARESPTLRLEFGELAITATPLTRGFELRGIHERDPLHVWTLATDAPLTARSLQRLLPPVTVPQLWLALGGDAGAVTSLAPGVEWLDVVREREGGVDSLVVLGRSGQRPVKLGVDATSFRVRRFAVRLSDEPDDLLVRVIAEPVGDAGGRDEWTIPLEGRERVASLSALSPRSRLINPGEPVPSLPLMTPAGEPWSLDAALTSLRADVERQNGAAIGVLVLVAASSATPESGLLEGVRAVKRAAQRSADAPGDRGPALIARTAAIVSYDAAAFARDRVVRDAQAWREHGTGAPLLWTTAPRRVLGSFDRGAGLLAIMIDARGRLIDSLKLADVGSPGGGGIDRIVEAFARERARWLPALDPGTETSGEGP